MVHLIKILIGFQLNTMFIRTTIIIFTLGTTSGRRNLLALKSLRIPQSSFRLNSSSWYFMNLCWLRVYILLWISSRYISSLRIGGFEWTLNCFLWGWLGLNCFYFVKIWLRNLFYPYLAYFGFNFLHFRMIFLWFI